jgi:hypothetical protein
MALVRIFLTWLVWLVVVVTGLLWGVLIAAYLAAAVLELSGIGLVVFDVREDRRKAADLLGYRRPRISIPRTPIGLHLRQPFGRSVGEEHRQRERQATYEREVERALDQIASVSARTDAIVLAALADLLGGDAYRRLVGPALIAVGIVIGTVANIVAA